MPYLFGLALRRLAASRTAIAAAYDESACSIRRCQSRQRILRLGLSDGLSGPRWSELSDGDEFAGYRIERRLGRGGMGILYLAIEPGLERRVALKLIAPEAAADEVFARRFAEESRIAASIEHPNVVPIYAAGEEDGVPYIAMRYVVRLRPGPAARPRGPAAAGRRGRR